MRFNSQRLIVDCAAIYERYHLSNYCCFGLCVYHTTCPRRNFGNIG